MGDVFLSLLCPWKTGAQVRNVPFEVDNGR
jgi:hypothetical protein